MLGKLPVPGRPTIRITVRQEPTARVRVVWTFYSHLFFLSSFSLSFLFFFGGGGGGWSGGAMVLGKLPVPGRPTIWIFFSRARAYCAYSRCRWGLFGHFYSPLSFLSSFSLSLGDGPI